MLRQLLAPAPFLFAIPMAVFAQQQVQQQAPQQVQPAQTPPAARPKPKIVKHKEVKKQAQAADVGGEKAHLLEKIKDWTVFIYEGSEGRVCFAATAPTDMQPKGAKRTPVIFYVTTWQKDGVRNEVSVKQGYSLKANSAATLTIGNQNFTLTPEEDKIFVKDAAEERKLIAAMSNGGAMIVKATSSKGTNTTDQYSLDGVAGAVKKLQEACP